MKKIAVCLALIAISGSIQYLGAQQMFSARDGYTLSPRMKMRMLNLFINIIFDQTPERDPLKDQTDYPWKAGKPNTLNTGVPDFLAGIMDPELSAEPPKGLITRYYYESSLGNFVCLGDFVVVNVAQSKITPKKPGADFGAWELINAAIDVINENGGVTTIFGHNNLSDYDFYGRGQPGLPKLAEPNGNIDFVQIIFRNTGRSYENGRIKYNFGQNNPGEGNFVDGTLPKSILIGGSACKTDMYSFQNLSLGEMLHPTKTIVIHEFAHGFLGSNSFHTSGGNHYGTHNAGPFLGLQGGWGIIGGFNSSLISCNGYERWRLGWIDTIQNPAKYDIACSGVNADITRADGTREFILRDFVSTGDAIRIRLPYKDEGTSNQYLWLENHQIGKNNRLDFLNYSSNNPCRDKGSSGIYTYIQVGKDILESERMGDVFPGDETDNLKVMTAKGYWDMLLVSMTDTLNCVAWRAVARSESYGKPNPLTGYCDQQQHMMDSSGTAKLISGEQFANFAAIIYRNGRQTSNLPYLGDNEDAFRGKTVLNMGTNPSPVNTITFYNNPGKAMFTPVQAARNNRHIYLSGLRIEMEELSNGNFRVKIRWDDHRIVNNVRWCGNIILQEQLRLAKSRTLLVDQGQTPVQVKRDSISNAFAPRSVLSVKSNAVVELEEKSTLVLDNGSTLVFEAGSVLKMGRKSRIIVRRNSKLIIGPGCEADIKSGSIILKSNGQYIYKPEQ